MNKHNMLHDQQFKIYYSVSMKISPNYYASISNPYCTEILITNPVLLTYEQLYGLIRIDITENIVDNFIAYFNKVVTFHNTFTYVVLMDGDALDTTQENIERLKFDIDVTEPFKLSKLIENVI